MKCICKTKRLVQDLATRAEFVTSNGNNSRYIQPLKGVDRDK